MIFGLIRLAIWLAGVAVVGYIVLMALGYEANWQYFDERKVKCQEALKQCQSDLVKTGLEGAKEKCNFQCIDPKLFMKKQ